MNSSFLKSFRIALICGATLTSLSPANAGQWSTLVDGLQEISDKALKPLKQLCIKKFEADIKSPKWKKRLNELNEATLFSNEQLEEFKNKLEYTFIDTTGTKSTTFKSYLSRISSNESLAVGDLEPFTQPMRVMTSFLDGDSLYALACTNNKAAVKIVVNELTVRFPYLVKRLMSLNDDGFIFNVRQSGPLHFIEEIGLPGFFNEATGTFEYASTPNEVYDLVGCIKPMFRVAVGPNGNSDLGLQAAHFIMTSKDSCSDHIFAPSEFLPFKKAFYSSKQVNTHSAIAAEETKEVFIYKIDGARVMEGFFKDALPQSRFSEEHDNFRSNLIQFKLQKDQSTFQDVREVATLLTQIDYFLDYPSETAGIVLSSLVNGPVQTIGNDDFGMPIVLKGAEESRTLEEKISDFRLMRTLILHAKTLGIKLQGNPNSSEDINWSQFLPAIRSEKQAELFIQRDLDKHFK